ncbi:hypothetical protein G6F68_016311 [Rhizopus microsporus]|nr:hypothetical protein G6F68_016311 [Rhizopus microsporus]
MHGQGAGTHARPRAKQQDATPRAIAAAAVRLRIQQPKHNILDFLRRDRRINKVADTCPQRGDRPLGLAQQTHRHARQCRGDARQRARQLGRLEQLSGLVFAKCEIQKHHLGRNFRQAPRQLFRPGRLLGQHPYVAQHLPQLHGDIRAFGAEQKPLAVLQANPLACMCLHISHREKPGICWPPMGPVR